jgi:hypothetical protein
VAAILVVVAALLLRGGGRLPDSPEAAVAELFDAASRGDDAAYLRLVAADLARSLNQTRSQLGTEAFCDSLRRSAAGIKGLAVGRAESAAPDAVALDVEIVFADRKERQRIVCTETARGWIITSMTGAEMIKPAIPYGTPVFDSDTAAARPSPSSDK